MHFWMQRQTNWLLIQRSMLQKMMSHSNVFWPWISKQCAFIWKMTVLIMFTQFSSCLVSFQLLKKIIYLSDCNVTIHFICFAAKVVRILPPEQGKMRMYRLTLGSLEDVHLMEAIYFGEAISIETGEFVFNLKSKFN